MRALILVAGAALAVSACSSNESADNTMNVDDVNLTADNVIIDNTMDANMSMDANMTMNADTTAIDTNVDANAVGNNAM